MGQFTTITIAGAPDLTDDQLEDARPGRDGEIWTDEETGTHQLTGHSKWSPSEAIGYAITLAAPIPDAVVTVDEEWDTSDVDEPGRTINHYRAGELIATRSQVTDLVPADLTEAIAAVRAAIAGDGDLTAAATWLVDGLTGERS